MMFRDCTLIVPKRSGGPGRKQTESVEVFGQVFGKPDGAVEALGCVFRERLGLSDDFRHIPGKPG